MEYILLLTAVCAATYTFEIVFGIAGTIMMLMVMTFFLDAKLLVIYSILPQILVAVIGLYRSPRTVNPREWLMMSVFALTGGLVGIIIFYHFPSDGFRYLLASVITLTGIYLVYSPKRISIGPRLGRGLDMLGGMSQGLVGISGPVVMTRLLGTYDNKTLVRNYALAFYLTLNLGRSAAYLINGTIGPELQKMMLISGPVLLVVLWFSNQLHFKTNEQLFRKVVSWVILVGGVSLFFH